MPHDGATPAPCEVGEDGAFEQSFTSPAETPRSKAFGSPVKGCDPWTSNQIQAPDNSSTLKPVHTRQRRRQQKAKMPYSDPKSVDGLSAKDQDDSKQLFQNRSNLISSPFNDIDNLVESSPIKKVVRHGGKMEKSFCHPPRSGQDAFFPAPDDYEGQDDMFDADQSLKSKPSNLTSYHKRSMSEASDKPATSKPGRVASSRQRKMSDASTIDERPKTKGVLNFSSVPPSVADSIDEKPPGKISSNMRGKSALEFQQESQAKTLVDLRKFVPKSRTKVKLPALDLKDDADIDSESNDPFDQANIPPSRGVSPGPSNRKSKRASKKRSTARSFKKSPLTKKPPLHDEKVVAKSAKALPKGRQPTGSRQTAKPSAVWMLNESLGLDSDEDDANGDYFPEKPDGPVSDDSQASTLQKGRAPPPTAERALEQRHASQKDVIYISSATESEDFGFDETGDDEYVDKSVSRTVESTKQPPQTRNTTFRPRVQNGVDATRAIRKAKKEQAGDDDADGLASRPLPKTSTKTAASRLQNPKTKFAIESQPTKRAVSTTASPSPGDNKTSTQKRRSSPQNQSSTDTTANKLSASKSAPRQVTQTETIDRSQVIPQVTNCDSLPTSSGPSDSYGKATCRSQANHPQSNLESPNSKASQRKERAESTESVISPFPRVIQNKREKRTAVVKNKEKKANDIAVGDEGPRAKGKQGETPRSPGYQSEQQETATSANSHISKAAKSDPSPSGNNGNIQLEDKSKEQPASFSNTPMAQLLQTQQLSLQVKHRQPVISSAVGSSTSSNKECAHGSDASQGCIEPIIRKSSTIFAEEEEEQHHRLPQTTNGRQSVQTQIKAGGRTTQSQKYDNADEMFEFQFADDSVGGLDAMVIPDSLEQPAENQHLDQQCELKQQPVMAKKHIRNEKNEVNQLNRELQISLDRRAPFHQLPQLDGFSQPVIGKGFGKAYSKRLLTALPRPSKRARLDVPEPNAEPSLPKPNSQIRVPANGYSSDDVFAPRISNKTGKIDHAIVDQLRGIGAVKHTRPETQGPMLAQSENTFELPHRSLITRVSAKALHPRRMQHICPGPSQDGTLEQMTGSDLWGQSMLDHRAQELLPDVKRKEQIMVEAPESYDGVEDAMHRIVANVIRGLQSKESEVHQVVDDYKTGGSRIVQSIAATHTGERNQLVEEHEGRRLGYIRICEEARHQIRLIGDSLQGIDLGKMVVCKTEDHTLDRLRRLQQTH